MKQLRAMMVAALLVAILSVSFGAPAEAGGNSDPCNKKNPPPECQIPEVPWTLVLPVAAVAIAGGYYLIQRRREGSDSTSAV
jgi:hypothetical protein